MKKFGNIYDRSPSRHFRVNQIPARDSLVRAVIQFGHPHGELYAIEASGLGFDFVGTSPGYADVDS